jgi:tetratricopeptide (TPR) repeat protein
VCGLATAFILLAGCVAVAAAPSRERIDYWRTKYQELQADPRAARAQVIFQRLVQVAGKRPGVVPRLFIAASDPWDLALPIALPDGWIVLSKGVLDICYQEPTLGEDRLAFVLAHELAHLLRDDFWHMRFFQATEADHAQQPVPREFLEEVRRTTTATDHLLPRELQADEQGIIYASMAGFNTHAIVTTVPARNFFADWVRALDPRRIGGVSAESMRPTPQERAEALRAHLRQVVGETGAFQVGLWFYYAGDYPRAIRAFDHFRAFFPSREVLHNLAVSHHQLALQAYQTWRRDVPAVPFELSLAIDPLTLASRIYLEGPKRGGRVTPADSAVLFRQHLDEAIAGYREAITQDEDYILSHLNLGSALIVRGGQTEKSGFNADFTEAVTTLQRALDRAPNTPDTPALLNTLGVAFFYTGLPAHAKEHLRRAQALAPTYTAPLVNLGHIAHTEHREAEAQRYWSEAQRLAGPTAPMPPAQKQPIEQVLELAIGQLEDNVPAHWGTPAKSTIRVGEEVFTLATYPMAVMTLARDGEIRMLMARDGYRGISARQITIGQEAQNVLTHYGPPTRRVVTTYGQNWSYDTHRIAFQLRDGKVVSWLVF